METTRHEKPGALFEPELIREIEPAGKEPAGMYFLVARSAGTIPKTPVILEK